MKKTLATIAALFLAVGAYGQGQLSFNTRIVGTVDAPVTNSANGLGVGSGFTAELDIVGAGGSLTPITPTTAFRAGTGLAPFYVNPIDITLTGRLGGSSVTLRMRAYNGVDYASSSIKGFSNDFTIVLGGDPGNGSPPSTPAPLAGLNGFSVVPEPSTIALGVLGLGALLLRRRK